MRWGDLVEVAALTPVEETGERRNQVDALEVAKPARARQRGTEPVVESREQGGVGYVGPRCIVRGDKAQAFPKARRGVVPR